MKYIVIYEEGFCLQEPDLFVYEAKNPEKMLAKVFLDKLHTYGNVSPEETLELRKTIQEAFDDDAWEHICEEGTFKAKHGDPVKYSLYCDRARLQFTDQYDSSYNFEINEDIYFPSEEDKEGYFDFLSSHVKATNIIWDLDNEDEDEDFKLPDEVKIPENIDDEEITDYLSNKFGFLVKSYKLEKTGLETTKNE